MALLPCKYQSHSEYSGIAVQSLVGVLGLIQSHHLNNKQSYPVLITMYLSSISTLLIKKRIYWTWEVIKHLIVISQTL